MTAPRWLSDLESLERAATPGPFFTKVAVRGIDRDVGIGAEGYANVIGEFYEEAHARGERRPREAAANADLWVALRNRAPQFLHALRAAMEMRDRLGRVMRLEGLGESCREIDAFDAAMQDADAEKEKK